MSITRQLRRLKTYAQRERTSNKVFTGHSAAVKFLASAPTIASIPTFGGIPEIIMVGRANVGKSTLINYVCQRKGLAITSTTAGRTQALNFYCVRRPGERIISILVDAPGYGSRGRPEWGRLFDHYIQNRVELRRVYILISAEHGVTQDDKLMLRFLEHESHSKKFTLQALLTKSDKIPPPILPQVVLALQRVISENSPSCLPAIVMAAGRLKFGSQALRQSILEACGWTARLTPVNRE